MVFWMIWFQCQGKSMTNKTVQHLIQQQQQQQQQQPLFTLKYYKYKYNNYYYK